MHAAPAIPPILSVTEPAREERVHALDNLRAWAMFFGILLHAAIPFMQTEFPWATRDVSTHWSFDLMVAFIHGFRMQLFFFIAGFFGRLLYERLGALEFTKHRLKRIGAPFILGMGVLTPLVGAIWILGILQMEKPMPMPENPNQGIGKIPTGHLWFLQYLLIVYAAAVVVAWVVKRFSEQLMNAMDRAFDAFFRWPFRTLLLVPPTVLMLWNGPIWGEVDHVGIGFYPKAHALAYYGLFFFIGWWLHRKRHRLDELSRYLKTGLGFAFLAMVVHIALIASQPKVGHPNYQLFKTVSLSCCALYAWQMTFTVTGWFLRFAKQHDSRMRYLADASYWCYLAHIPLVLWLQIAVAKWSVNGWLKFILINVLTMALLLWIYDHFVRYSFLGTMLNGKRTRPTQTPTPVPAAG